jgi:D-sedoheptulose 7-phosphate isomerase
MSKPDAWENCIATHFANHRQVTADALAALAGPIRRSGAVMVAALRGGHQALTFGNGGSASQASHLAGELIGRYSRTRRPFPAIALAADHGVVTCIANDFGYAALFERQIQALARPGDIAIGFSTSGKSPNVLAGLAAAKQAGATTIALTGAAGIGCEVDHLLAVPSTTTAHIQEVHLMVLHLWCELLDLDGDA